ncbi:MAG TPA: DUF1684 domain-containing protein [Arthrobacter sp.]|nr:DUF1684 domain-containing protein [Arthrobacter sp.]
MGNSSEDARRRDSWLRFRDHRNRALAVEHGWLTLTSLQWLPAEPAPLDQVTGLWSANGRASAGGHATLTAGADDGLYFMETGELVVGTFTATLGNEESLLWVRRGSIAVELAARGDRYAIRTRDNDSPVQTDFEAVPVFDYNPDLVVAGRFDAYDQPRTLPIATSNPDVPGVITAVGTVSFELDGTRHTLVAEPEKLGALSLNFHDDTNGATTAGWRSVATRRPGPDGTVLIDFNRATNFPSAFTDFGTCPMPVDGNVIVAPVEAGERRAR